MKSMKEIANESQINETLVYDEIIQKLNEAKENGTPIEEGLLGAIGGTIIGTAMGPKLGLAICRGLGIEQKGALGNLITSKLVMGSICGYMGWKM